VAPHLFTHADVAARVDCSQGIGRGRTVIDRWGRKPRAPNARFLDKVNADGFFDLVIERLARLP